MSVNIEEILGGKVKSVLAYVSDPFGGVPAICLSRIVMEDGREFWVEGEHDTAYIPIEKHKMEMGRLVGAIEQDEDTAELIESIGEIFE